MPRSFLIRLLAVVTFSLALTSAARTQGPVLVVQPSAVVQTVAGTGAEGFSGDSGPATSAKIASPTAIVTDAAGNLYFADRDNHCVRKIDTTGKIVTVAGNGMEGYGGDGGPATSAMLDSPSGVAVDSADNLFIADTNNNRIREVRNGVITTYAGTGVGGFCGDGGPPAAACLFSPRGVAIDSSDGLYIADSGNNRVRFISGGVVTTVAGTVFQGNAGDGGPATSAALDVPSGVMIDSSGTLYIADASNDRIRAVSGGVIAAFAGTSTEGYSGDGGPATAAQMAFPKSIREDVFGRLLIADTNNNVIRQVATGTIATVAGVDLEGPALGNSPAAAVFDTPTDTVPIITGFYVTDTNNQRIRRVDYSALDFGKVAVGNTSAPKTITLSNSGTANVIISAEQLTGSAFHIVSGGSCPATFPFTITPNTSCIINVAFSPAATTTYAEKNILTRQCAWQSANGDHNRRRSVESDHAGVERAACGPGVRRRGDDFCENRRHCRFERAATNWEYRVHRCRRAARHSGRDPKNCGREPAVVSGRHTHDFRVVWRRFTLFIERGEPEPERRESYADHFACFRPVTGCGWNTRGFDGERAVSRQRANRVGRLSGRNDGTRHCSAQFRRRRYPGHCRAWRGFAFDRCALRRRFQLQRSDLGGSWPGRRVVHPKSVGCNSERNVGNGHAHDCAHQWIQSNGRALVFLAACELGLRIHAVERHVERDWRGNRVVDDHDASILLEHRRHGDFWE